MEILTFRNNQTYILRLRGELDAKTSDDVERILDEVVKLEPQAIRIDCKELKYISSRGLGVFISRYQEIQEKGINFFMFNMSDQIRYVFKVLGLDNIIVINPAESIAG